MEWKRSVRLHGEMADLFGGEWELAVNTPAEAVRALVTNRPKLRNYLREAESQGVGFAVILTDDREDGEKRYTLGDHQLHHPMGGKSLDFVPVPLGAGTNPVLKIILGVALLASAFVLGPTSLFGLAGTGLNVIGGGAALFIGGIGASLLLGGVTQLLAPVPEIGDLQDESERPEDRPSYAFSGATNTVAQGRPVPLGYGEMVVGSHVVSAGIVTFDVDPTTGEPPDGTVSVPVSPSNPPEEDTGGGGFDPKDPALDDIQVPIPKIRPSGLF